MTDAQVLIAMIAYGAFVATMILGILSVVIGMLNLLKKK